MRKGDAMKFILILMLAGGGQVESGVVYPTLAECEAAGQTTLRGQKKLVLFSNYRCEKRKP
jgi:hypothetical protein